MYFSSFHLYAFLYASFLFRLQDAMRMIPYSALIRLVSIYSLTHHIMLFSITSLFLQFNQFSGKTDFYQNFSSKTSFFRLISQKYSPHRFQRQMMILKSKKNHGQLYFSQPWLCSFSVFLISLPGSYRYLPVLRSVRRFLLPSSALPVSDKTVRYGCWNPADLCHTGKLLRHLS